MTSSPLRDFCVDIQPQAIKRTGSGRCACAECSGQLTDPARSKTPIDGGSVRRNFHQLLRRAGIPAMRVHDLRHSWATIQLAMGTPAKVVQEQLGHASIGVTMNTYSHVVPAMMQAAADAMDRALAVPR
jgi:integrase